MILENSNVKELNNITQVSKLLDVKQYVIRFWETKFSQIRPIKMSTNRRYYRPTDIELLQKIKYYLYEKGYTIKGVQQILSKAEPQTNDITLSDASLAAPLLPLLEIQSPEMILSQEEENASSDHIFFNSILEELQGIKRDIQTVKSTL